MVANDATPGVDRLPFHIKFFFGLGAAAEAVGLGVIGAFALFYYNQVLGMSAALAGLAISLGLIFDAVSDPLMGSISDRTRSRLGRRHPFMFAAPIPVALCIWMVYHPPANLRELWLFFWFAGFVMAMRTFMTVFHVPHLALGGELSPHYTERTSVMSYNNLVGFLGAAGVYWISLTIFFHATPKYHNGQFNPAAYPKLALASALFVMLVQFASAWFTRSVIPRLPRPPDNLPKYSPFEFFRDVKAAVTNRNYLVMLIALFCLTCMLGMRGGLGIYIQTYLWNLLPAQRRWFVFGTLVGHFTAFSITAMLHRIFDKRATIIVGALGLTLFPSTLVALRLMGWFPDNHWPYLITVLVAWSVLASWSGAVLNISVLSALDEIVDENELRLGTRQEGVIYSTRTFFSKMDNAFGHLLAGLALSAISFPIPARPGLVAHAIIWKLGFVYAAVPVVPGLIATFFYSKYRINRKRYDEVRQLLVERKEASAPPASNPDS